MSTERLASYIAGRWVAEGQSESTTLLNPATEEPLALRIGKPNVEAALIHARSTGGPALRELTFKARGELLRHMSRVIHANRDMLLMTSIANGGNTRSDAKFDVDGASATLAHYAELGVSLGTTNVIPEGACEKLGRSARLAGQHVLVPRTGVAVHINAFNFPAWGLAEKAACALLAGVPVLTRPATATALLAYRIVQLLVDNQVLPEGAMQLLLGPVDGLLERLEGQDALAFTGSSATGVRLRSTPELIAAGVRTNIEADSVNAAVIGPDVAPGSPTWDLMIGEIAREMTQKAGQKCTAIRRVLVPHELRTPVSEALAERLAQVVVGNPAFDSVTMGPLATAEQLRDARSGTLRLREEADVVVWDAGQVRTPLGAPPGKGFFFGPVLLVATRAEASLVHEHEVFGPVATLLPYDGRARTASEKVARGGGGLVASVYSADKTFVTELVRGAAPHVGRIYIGSGTILGQSPGPGAVLPQLVHGGPGRAGAGEELGGLRGLSLYLQRTALEGDRAFVEALYDSAHGAGRADL